MKQYYPKLHRTLSRHFGESMATSLIRNLHIQKLSGLDFGDSAKLVGAVKFAETKEGHRYWAALHKATDPNWG